MPRPHLFSGFLLLSSSRRRRLLPMMLHRAPPPRDAPPRASPSCSSPSTTGRGHGTGRRGPRGRGSGGHVASLAGKRDGVARLYGEVGLGSHKPDSVVVALLWTHSEDLGEGFHGLGSVTDISFVLDAANAVPEAGGVHYGTPILVFPWNGCSNQRWKMVPFY